MKRFMNCPYCGKFMEKTEDWERCAIIWRCVECCGCGGDYIHIVDYESFDEVWDEIDYQRYQDDPSWIDRLYEVGTS